MKLKDLEVRVDSTKNSQNPHPEENKTAQAQVKVPNLDLPL